MPAVSQSYVLPPPIGGWNDRDALDLMQEQDAIRLVNVFPDIGNVKLRNGSRTYSTGMTGAVQTLCEYNSKAGARQLIAAANGSVFDASASGVPATSLGSGFTNNYWSTINFHDTMLFCNGVDQPQQYDGTTLSAATYTGIADNNTIVHWNSYRSRLYGVQVASTSVWYSNTVDAITGLLVEFNVGGVLTKGGTLLWTSSWTRDKGSGSTDLFIMCSSQGELLVYSGPNPGDTSWTIVGHFYIPIPLGRRSFVKLSSTVGILTELGLLPLSDILQDTETAITDKIKNAFGAATQLYKANTGWDCLYYPRGKMLITNIPLATDTQSEQYVMNTLTGAWCKFTGWTAFCWALLNEKLYFGGPAGVVYEADSGYSDNGNAITFDVKSSFSYFGDRTRIKQLVLAKPIILGDLAGTYDFGVDTDFSETTHIEPTIAVTGTTGSPWDTELWDVASWDTGSVYNDSWAGASGVGRAFALRLAGMFKNAPFSLNATQVIYKSGGVI